MVIDNIKNAWIYMALGPDFKTAFDWLINTDMTGLDEGKCDVDDDRIFAFVQNYTTVPAEAAKAESHERYIDIQYVVSGNEKLGYDPIEQASPSGEAIPEADLIFYRPLNQYINMLPGTFAILWPQDVHAPRCILDEPEDIVKIVVKIKI